MAEAIWTEKYRPHAFSDIKGQAEIVARVKAFVEKKNMPHLLFSGPAGVGKTTLALVIGHSLFSTAFHNNFLELNASDERGIDVIRNKVKDFARTMAMGDVPFKIIYLDECDALTKEAQQALRRTMENYTQSTRFILSCNYSSKIIDPIQSRCAMFRFTLLDKEDLATIIERIAKHEKLHINAEARDALIEVSEGDCRRLENVMQSCAVMSDKITEELVYSLVSAAKPKEVREVIDLALKNKFADARAKLLDVMLSHGLSGEDIIKHIQKGVMELDAPNEDKMRIIIACAEAEFRIREGSDQYIQLEALLAQMAISQGK